MKGLILWTCNLEESKKEWEREGETVRGDLVMGEFYNFLGGIGPSLVYGEGGGEGDADGI